MTSCTASVRPNTVNKSFKWLAKLHPTLNRWALLDYHVQLLHSYWLSLYTELANIPSFDLTVKVLSIVVRLNLIHVVLLSFSLQACSIPGTEATLTMLLNPRFKSARLFFDSWFFRICVHVGCPRLHVVVVGVTIWHLYDECSCLHDNKPAVTHEMQLGEKDKRHDNASVLQDITNQQATLNIFRFMHQQGLTDWLYPYQIIVTGFSAC